MSIHPLDIVLSQGIERYNWRNKMINLLSSNYWYSCGNTHVNC